jgi:electron transfer flavoprotein beta subunit
MKILILFKPILDPAGMMINRKAGKVFINKKEWLMNPSDARALEGALKIKAIKGDTVIHAVAVGGDPALNLLRDAKALGVDRAFTIQNVDALTPRLIVALAAHLGVEMILCGDSALDTGENIAAPVAELLNFTYLGNAIACYLEGLSVRVVKMQNREPRAYEGTLPAVITFARTAPALRLAHGGNIITAYRDLNAVETLTLAQLGLTEAPISTLSVRDQTTPPEREFGKQVTLDELAKLIK